MTHLRKFYRVNTEEPKVFEDPEEAAAYLATHRTPGDENSQPVPFTMGASSERRMMEALLSLLLKFQLVGSSVVANAADSNSFGPENPQDEDFEDYPRDEDGDVWYADLFELREACSDAEELFQSSQEGEGE